MIIVDCETTGLDPRRHRPWEVAIIDLDAGDWTRLVWRPHPRWYGLADVKALEIGRFGDRAPDVHCAEAEQVYAETVSEVLEGRMVAGSNPDFDIRMLTAWLADWQLPCRPHYRTLDVPTLAAGRLLAAGETVSWPIRSYEVSAQLGVDPPDGEAHTALGDAMWILRLWQAVTA